MRIHGPWLFITTLVRVGAYINFGDKTWYDVTLVTFAGASLHFTAEFFIHGTIPRSTFLKAGGFDVGGLIWMWLARDAVTGAHN